MAMHFRERWKFWRARRNRENQARRLLIRARKFLAFHRDLLSDERRERLILAADQLENAIKTRALNPKDLENVNKMLFCHGKSQATARNSRELFETIFVALVIAVSIRTFFVQPFQIPTNSMKPSYFGMTAQLADPMPLTFWDRFLQGATTYILQSKEQNGALFIQLNGREQMIQQQSLLHYEIVNRRQWGIWPQKWRRYFFRVENECVTIDLPQEFDFESVILNAFFPNSFGRLMDVLSMAAPIHRDGIPYLFLSKDVAAGTSFLEFNLYHGDMLLVDRLTLHFFPPKRGESVVFLTQKVPSLRDLDRYYIKRLVAIPGDRVAIFDDQLWINERPADFNAAMRANNHHEFPYFGYLPLGNLNENTVSVSENSYFVLGDNSSNSYDSRFFGEIPQKALCGRPLWVFYPLNRNP